MITYIKNLIVKYFYRPKCIPIIKETATLRNGLITFGLNNDDGIAIHCLLPKINLDDPDTIAVEAERFAEMLLCLNEGLLKKEIINVLTNQYDIENNPNQKLLIENILNFWSILYGHYKTEKKKSAKDSSKLPLIRPTAVFSAKR